MLLLGLSTLNSKALSKINKKNDADGQDQVINSKIHNNLTGIQGII